MELEAYALVKRSVRTLLDINLDSYKDEQMRRRLDTWLARSGAKTWAEYFRRARAEPEELARLRSYLTINVSAFFRDLDHWQELRDRVLPALLRSRPRLRVWSAGCSIGAEPYSLLMLLDAVNPLRRHTLLATDLDRGALARARAGGPFTAQDLENVSAAQRAAYFEPGGPPFFAAPHLARRIEFREHNLLADEFESDFDLILCRNVVIYFTHQAKDQVYQKLYAALRPGGVLFIGGTEILPPALRLNFQNRYVSFYEKEN